MAEVKSPKLWKYFIYTFVAILSVCLITELLIVPMIIEWGIKTTFELRKDSWIRPIWEKFPFYLETNIYIFNVTNPEEVASGGIPVLDEIGPYFFEEWKSKTQLEDNAQDDTVTFYMKDVFIFRPDKSNGLTGDEMVTVLHPMLAGLTYTVKRDREPMLPLVAGAIDPLFNNPKSPFLTTKAMDLMFNGIPINCESNEFGPKAICTALETEAKGLNKINSTHYSFSLFSAKNATETNKFTVYRGIKNAKDVGRVIKWNDEPEMDVWDTDACNQYKGTDGTIFPPFNKREDGIWGFVPDLCRPVKSHWEKPSSYVGIPTDRYIVDFGDYKKDKSLHCYCKDPPDDCPARGTVDLFNCASVPLVASLPHFYDCDPELLTKVKGLSPDKEKHGIAIDFERLTGTPLRARNRLQISFDVSPVEDIEIFKNMPDMIFPLVWIEEGVALNKTFSNMLKYQLFLPKKISSIFSWLMIIFGLIGSAASGYFFIKNKNNTMSVSPVNSAEKPSALAFVGNANKENDSIADLQRQSAITRDTRQTLNAKLTSVLHGNQNLNGTQFDPPKY